MKKILVFGSNGSVGKGLQRFAEQNGLLEHFHFTVRNTFDITDYEQYYNTNWNEYYAIINAAGLTRPDNSENHEGRIDAWQANAHATMLMAKIANENNLTLVYLSTEYVFDGEEKVYTEKSKVCPISQYGASKAAGELSAGTAEKNYIVRITFLDGEQKGFITKMVHLARKNVPCKVVNDIISKPSFTSSLSEAVWHLLQKKCEFGIYNFCNSGKPISRSELAEKIYSLVGADPNLVVPVDSKTYYSKAENGIVYANRPKSTILKTDKIESTGLKIENWEKLFCDYIKTVE